MVKILVSYRVRTLFPFLTKIILSTLSLILLISFWIWNDGIYRLKIFLHRKQRIVLYRFSKMNLLIIAIILFNHMMMVSLMLLKILLRCNLMKQWYCRLNRFRSWPCLSYWRSLVKCIWEKVVKCSTNS